MIRAIKYAKNNQYQQPLIIKKIKMFSTFWSNEQEDSVHPELKRYCHHW